MSDSASLFGDPPCKKQDEVETWTSIDYDELVERCMGDEVFARRVLLRFRDTYGELADAIAVALSTNDLDRIASEAHRLKGAASNLSAINVQRAAQELEAAARENEGDQILSKINQLITNLEQMMSEVDGLLGTKA